MYDVLSWTKVERHHLEFTPKETITIWLTHPTNGTLLFLINEN